LPSRANTRRRPAGALAAHTALHESTDHGIEPVGIHLTQDPADRRLRRAPAIGSERARHIGR
jgi:hypothetical protein